MFAKLMGWTALLERADAERERVYVDLREVKKEVRRLTDIIVHLKQDGMVIDPGHGEEVWPEGKYIMDEGFKDEDTQTFDEREASLADAELEAELRTLDL